MTSLLSRAKPQLKEAIAAFSIKYPNSAEHVRRSLSKAVGVSFLTYGVIMELRTILRSADLVFDINDPWEWFED
jgi:hypothetical protein